MREQTLSEAPRSLLEQRFVDAVAAADPLHRLSAEDRVIRVAAVRAAYYRREAQRRRIRFARNAR